MEKINNIEDKNNFIRKEINDNIFIEENGKKEDEKGEIKDKNDNDDDDDFIMADNIGDNNNNNNNNINDNNNHDNE